MGGGPDGTGGRPLCCCWVAVFERESAGLAAMAARAALTRVPDCGMSSSV